MADRIGVMNKGGLILVEGKDALMRSFGKKQLTLQLAQPMMRIPPELAAWDLKLEGAHQLVLTMGAGDAEIPALLERMSGLAIAIRDLQTHQSSLEDIFVKLVSGRA